MPRPRLVRPRLFRPGGARAALAVLWLLAALPAAAADAPAPLNAPGPDARASTRDEPEIEPRHIRFDIMLGPSRIGSHEVVVRREGDRLIAETDMELEVGFLFFTAFSYDHHSREVWKDGRLSAIDATTDDDGTERWVKGHATEDGFEVTSSSGDWTAPPDVMPASWWHPRSPEAEIFINTEKGKRYELEFESLETAIMNNGLVVRNYDVTGKLDPELAYSVEDGLWVGMIFEVDGRTIRYRPNGHIRQAARR